MKLRRLFDFMPPGTRSLRNVLALYFIPISIIPVLVISGYATREFQQSGNRFLVSRAKSEFDAIVAELGTTESRLLDGARDHVSRFRLVRAVEMRNASLVRQAISAFQNNFDVRVYTPNGDFLAGRQVSPGKEQVAYISPAGLRAVRQKQITGDRYYASNNRGVVFVVRALIKNDRGDSVGILEEHHYFGDVQLQAIQQRRQVDALIMKPDFSIVAESFAVSKDALTPLTQAAFRPDYLDPEPVLIRLGDQRYASFIFALQSDGVRVTKLEGKHEPWGYLALFVSMESLDSTTGRLRLYMVYLTALLVLVAMLFILAVARRLVRPLDILISGMRRLKSGNLEQIPELDAPDEIEYLVRSFNDMARNIFGAKRALEAKIQELHHANEAIRNAQGSLVQTAKMVSLGQIVAGVAHELNNPIAFIYSNMHHLLDYIDKIRAMVKEYDEAMKKLGPEDQARVQKRLKELEMDYILKDIDSLTKSCLDGAQRTKEIVLGLRTFSRTDKAVVKPSDINEGLRSTRRLLVPQFKDRIRVHEELAADLPLVECNLSQLNQVFMNLLSNAAQAIPAGGEIFIRTFQKGENVVIEIEDTGTGMPQHVVDHIFDPFFTTKAVGEGTGLGLSIAYNLVQKHQGTIEVQSKEGMGTCFTLTIPIKQAPEKSQKTFGT